MWLELSEQWGEGHERKLETAAGPSRCRGYTASLFNRGTVRPVTTANEQGQEDAHHPSGKSTESVRFGSRFPAGVLLMRAGWQKGTPLDIGYLSTWAVVWGSDLSSTTYQLLHFLWA